MTTDSIYGSEICQETSLKYFQPLKCKPSLSILKDIGYIKKTYFSVEKYHWSKMHEINLSILRISFSKIKITSKLLKFSFLTRIQNSLNSKNSHKPQISRQMCHCHKWATFEPIFYIFMVKMNEKIDFLNIVASALKFGKYFCGGAVESQISM